MNAKLIVHVSIWDRERDGFEFAMRSYVGKTFGDSALLVDRKLGRYLLILTFETSPGEWTANFGNAADLDDLAGVVNGYVFDTLALDRDLTIEHFATPEVAALIDATFKKHTAAFTQRQVSDEAVPANDKGFVGR